MDESVTAKRTDKLHTEDPEGLQGSDGTKHPIVRRRARNLRQSNLSETGMHRLHPGKPIEDRDGYHLRQWSIGR